MQIHELQSLPRNPASGDYFAVDTGTITGKTGFAEMQTAIAGPAAAAAAAAASAAAAAASTATAALGNFAGAFSDSTPYTAGQYVTYTDGKLYRFTADHAAGAWDASDVVAATMGGEVEALKSALTTVTNVLDFDIPLSKGDYAYNYRVYPGGVANVSDGSRIRLIYKLDKPYSFKLKCTEGKGIAVSLYADSTNALLVNTNYIKTWNNYEYSKDYVVANNEQSTGYLAISFCKNDSSAITNAEWDTFYNSLEFEMVIHSEDSQRLIGIEKSIAGYGNDISPLDFNGDMNDSIVALSKSNLYISGGLDNPQAVKKNLSFSVVTDLHGSSTSLSRFVSFVNAKKQYLDFCVGLGDFVKSVPSESTAWIDNSIRNLDIPFFYVVGNHDAADTGDYAITQAQCRTKYFSTIETKTWLSASDFEGTGKCSWYKDFSNYNIRIISLFEYGNSLESSNSPASYCRRWIDSETLQWFADTLYSTPSGYSVAILMHQFPSAPMTFVENPFTVTESLSYAAQNWNRVFLNTIDGNPIEEIVNAFITKTAISKTYNSISSYGLGKSATVDKDFSAMADYGKFIAYFAGHTHASYIWKSATFPNQICIVVPTGSSDIFQRQYGDMLYDSNTRNRDSFYVVGIDTTTHTINLAQIGGQVTTDLRKREIASIDYLPNA